MKLQAKIFRKLALGLVMLVILEMLMKFLRLIRIWRHLWSVQIKVSAYWIIQREAEALFWELRSVISFAICSGLQNLLMGRYWSRNCWRRRLIYSRDLSKKAPYRDIIYIKILRVCKSILKSKTLDKLNLMRIGFLFKRLKLLKKLFFMKVIESMLDWAGTAQYLKLVRSLSQRYFHQLSLPATLRFIPYRK